MQCQGSASRWQLLAELQADVSTGMSDTPFVADITSFWWHAGNRTAVLVVAKLFLAAGLALLSGNIGNAQDSRILVMLGLAIACGYIYQGPPFRQAIQH